MGAFEYTALDAAGREKKGVLEADGPKQIRQRIREQGLTPIAIDEVTEQRAAGHGGMKWRRGVSSAELALLTRQLATLVGSGLPVEEALSAVAQQSDRASVKKMMLAVRARVMEGHDLAAALADFPSLFSDLYQATVAAGEQSGHLNVVLERLADYTETRQALRQNIVMALIYPVLIIIVAVIMMVGLMTYIVPQVVQVFEDMGQELPLLTRLMIAASEQVREKGVVVTLGIIVIVLGLRWLLKRDTFKTRYHKLQLKLPFLSSLVRGLGAARFSRTLSILIESGVPLLDALRIAGQVLTNIPMRDSVTTAARLVSEGASLHDALDRSGYFPPLTLHLIASGEASGRLEMMLERAASSQERDLEAVTKTMLSILGPAVILLMGGMVLLIVLAMLLPIFELNELIS